MDVALQAPPLLVLGGHQALTGGPEVLDEPDVAKDEARLRRQVADQLLLRGVHRVGGGHPDGQRPEQLAPVAHLDGGLTRNGPSRRLIGDGHRPWVVASAGHTAAGRSSAPDRSHTRATSAPAPSPRTWAIRGRTSSVA